MSETEVVEKSVLPARVIEPPGPKLSKYGKNTQLAHVEIAAQEDDIYEKAFNVIDSVMDFAKVDPDAPQLRQELVDDWINEGMTPEDAGRRYRLALVGWVKKSDMPVGVALAQETFVGITKARSKQPTQHVHFTAEYMSFGAPQVYPEQIEEGDS